MSKGEKGGERDEKRTDSQSLAARDMVRNARKARRYNSCMCCSSGQRFTERIGSRLVIPGLDIVSSGGS